MTIPPMPPGFLPAAIPGFVRADPSLKTIVEYMEYLEKRYLGYVQRTAAVFNDVNYSNHNQVVNPEEGDMFFYSNGKIWRYKSAKWEQFGEFTPKVV